MHIAALYQGILPLLLYFTWVLVGLVAPDDMRGEIFLRGIAEEMTNHGLCVAFAEKVTEFSAKKSVNMKNFMERVTLTGVIVAFGDTHDFLISVYLSIDYAPFRNVWITTSDWYITLPIEQNLVYRYFGGGLLFSFCMDEIMGFEDFLRSIQPRKYPHDIFIQEVWSIYLNAHISIRMESGNEVNVSQMAA